MYTVGEFRKYLEEADLDDDMPMVIQKDGAGTAFSPLTGFGVEHYRSYNDYSGHVTHQPRKDDVQALVLAPVA